MTDRIVIRTLTPCPSLVAGRACKTVYLDAGRAWVCEHWHEGLL
jgi:hypothetical protein